MQSKKSVKGVAPRTIIAGLSSKERSRRYTIGKSTNTYPATASQRFERSVPISDIKSAIKSADTPIYTEYPREQRKFIPIGKRELCREP